MRILLVICVSLLEWSQGYRPLRPLVRRSFPRSREEDVGPPLFLTPYIESGDVETGRKLAHVNTSMLKGMEEDMESYSGFLTVDKVNNGNMFFWFFPAEEDPENAPVVIWLQGGPGGSSMFGLLKLHGPILTTVNRNNQLIGVKKNKFSWAKKHNMLYIDNPVGAGFSFSNALPTTQREVIDNLYEFLQQWFTLFPSYQANPFFAFGESYAGKFVPSLTRRIHQENTSGRNVISINVAGMGIGNGWMSPYHNAQYGNFLYQAGLLDRKQRDRCLQMEANTQSFIEKGDFYNAKMSWDREFEYFRNNMDCLYPYNIAICDYDPALYNYEDFLNWESSRKALHVGPLDYPNSGDVSKSMINVFMDDEREDIEFCLENYRTLIYNGNFDIICNHSGILDMIADLRWSGSATYSRADRQVYHYNGSDVVGYLTKAGNLNLLMVRNAGHLVPLSQPRYAQHMIQEFTCGAM